MEDFHLNEEALIHYCTSIITVPSLFLGISNFSVSGVFKQTNRQTDEQIDRRTDRQTNRQTDEQIDRRTDRQTNRQTDEQIDRRTDRQTNRQTDEQIDRRTDIPFIDRRKDRQTDRRTENLELILYYLFKFLRKS